LICDALGSIIALIDSTGTVQTEYTGPFGNTTVSGTSNTNQSQYTGRENDSTGLIYNRTRYYSPQLQRFVSEDPLEFDGGDVNIYAYVANSPTNYTDPYGLELLTGQQYQEAANGLAGSLGGRKSDEVRFCRFLGIIGTFAAGFSDHIDFGFSDAVRD